VCRCDNLQRALRNAGLRAGESKTPAAERRLAHQGDLLFRAAVLVLLRVADTEVENYGKEGHKTDSSKNHPEHGSLPLRVSYHAGLRCAIGTGRSFVTAAHSIGSMNPALRSRWK
jgi:hypothetical protein